MSAQISQSSGVAGAPALLGESTLSKCERPGFVLLESTLFANNRGRNSFVAQSPVRQWRIEAGEPVPQNWKVLLDEFLSDRDAFYTAFLSYDFGVEVNLGHALQAPGDLATPKLVCYAYDTVEVDFSLPKLRPRTEDYAPVAQGPDTARYLRDIATIKKHIYEGDIYQANYTGRWCVTSQANPFEVYSRLRTLNPAQYCAYAQVGTELHPQSIISSSPERLFRIEGRQITANPIKGTIERGATPDETARNRKRLLASEKDRAELLMIVDLLRNDLGKVCEPGSVVTPAIWRAEEFSSVIHLVGEIIGELRADVTVADALEATFPGGSITGAPKRRAVEILRDIEQRPRGWYTGSFGYVYGDIAEFNIAIRTLTYDSGVYDIQAGGGIVADSHPESELAEAKLKARNLFKAIDPSLEP